jgi:hypothetical protein
VRVQVVLRFFLSLIQDPICRGIGPVTNSVGQDIAQGLLAIGIGTTGGLIEGGAGECHKEHLNETAIKCDTPLHQCCGGYYDSYSRCCYLDSISTTKLGSRYDA